MTEERRKFNRFIVVDLKLFHKETGEHVGQVVNLSEGGLLAVAEEPLEHNSFHQFRIPFNQTIYNDGDFEFKGRVTWSKPNSIDPTKFSIGLEFSSISDSQIAFIHKLIDAQRE